MATAADAEVFAAQWSLDEAARSALLQLDPDVQAKVITDFAPKAGTRDVNRLFHGFLRSVRTTALGGHGGPPPPRAPRIPEASALPETFLIAAADEKLAGQGELVDVEAFVVRWGLDESAQAMMLEQSPEVQARVMASFAPKPGTRDVNRLLHGFIRSVRDAPGPPQGASQPVAAAAAADPFAASQLQEAQDAMFAEEAAAMSFDADELLAAVEEDVAAAQQAQAVARPVKRKFGATTAVDAAAPSMIGGAESFIAQWNLDAAAQAALQQLPPDVQAKVLTDFAPKAGTRDVNRLFLGFIRSVQGSGGQARPGGVVAPRAPAAPHSYTSYRPPAPVAQLGYTAYRPPSNAYLAAAPRARAAPAAAPPVQQLSQAQAARLQSFVDHWGLDEGSVQSLVQLPADTQTRVVAEFSPKPHTQDINRLFKGFIRSVLGGAAAPRPPRVYTITKQTVPAQAASYEDLPSEALDAGQAVDVGLPVMDAGFDAAALTMAEAVDESEGLTREELDAFGQTWGLGEDCLQMLEGQSPSVQRRVLEQFRPKPGTRDVRNLFFGFIKSVASGGAKRPRFV